MVGFFLGSTPFDTRALYKLLNYTELIHDGYWNVKGGMYRITEALVNELNNRGVKIVYNTEIKEVVREGKNIKHFTDQHGKNWTGDVYVCNSDAAAFRGSILSRKNIVKRI